MASYPEPNGTAEEAVTEPSHPPPQPHHVQPQPNSPSSSHSHQHHHQHHHQQQPHQLPSASDHSYDDTLSSSVPATTVAHHGLQVLQAASATPLSPVNGNDLPLAQYAQSAAMQMGAQYAQSSSMQMDDGHLSTPLTDPTAANGPIPSNHASQKVTRLRRACDMCSQRKVKCDESGPPCKPCSDLQVECTFRREMKRRGPPNKHAEAAKAAKRQRPDEVSPVPHNAAQALVSIAAHDRDTTLPMDAETIAPWPILQLLVDDFFTYIHPLMPFPHEPTFRQNFVNRMDKSNGEFLALLASMIGILVASFPRSARAHLKAQHSAGLFPTSFTMIDHCRDIALDARGSRLEMKSELSVDDAATSYFLGLAAAYTLKWKPCKRFMAQTMSFCRELVPNRQRDLSATVLEDEFRNASNTSTDHIKDQIGKRIFWVMVAGVRSMTQLGASINELPLPPPTTQEPYPDMPLEVDDEYIYAAQVLPQPEGTFPLITGFNRNIRIYMTMNELIGVDMCYGINFFDWSAQKNILSNGLAAAKQSAEEMPPELQVKVDPNKIDSPGFDVSGYQYHPPAYPNAQPSNDLRHALAEQPLRRRQLQCEIQKANIYASQLATRSYFVERYLNLRDAHRSQTNFRETEEDAGDDRDAMVANERELIVRNLLTVLASISQRNMEPNGQSLINKIRQVASTLMSVAPERKGPVAIKSEDALSRFLDILMKLEKSGTAPHSETMTSQDEEVELQHWASLREYQLHFVSQGGYISDI
ncbi:hypothetical protein F5Y15DRAFT_114923 [Xylariaceae sp. FL0016]|nr:hypothetical protein F5Y15DRAFT_114923 [Xylariaceae sp. FL0016]